MASAPLDDDPAGATMASEQLPRPRTRTLSRCAPRVARGTHSFDIAGYSYLIKGLSDGQYFIQSGAFDVGGCSWCIRYFPGGREVIAVHLELLSQDHVRACFNFRLVNPVNGSSTAMSSSAVQLFDTVSKDIRFGRGHIMLGKELDGSEFLRDDRLVIECDVTVFMEPQVVAMISTASSMGDDDGEVPPPDVAEDLANLLGAEEGADVTFKVQDEVFNAHAIVLAMRSRVFKKEFYGHMKESSRVHQQDRTVIVEDMQPAVFRALLRFIYTDCLVFTDVSDHDEDKTELTKHLLVAADRYDIPGLRFLCQKDLCESLAVETVAATLAFADQHNCIKLKDACIEFITSLPSIDDLVASEGYKILKESYPACLVDIFESVTRELYASRSQLIQHDI